MSRFGNYSQAVVTIEFCRFIQYWIARQIRLKVSRACAAAATYEDKARHRADVLNTRTSDQLTASNAATEL